MNEVHELIKKSEKPVLIIPKQSQNAEFSGN